MQPRPFNSVPRPERLRCTAQIYVSSRRTTFPRPSSTVVRCRRGPLPANTAMSESTASDRTHDHQDDPDVVDIESMLIRPDRHGKIENCADGKGDDARYQSTCHCPALLVRGSIGVGYSRTPAPLQTPSHSDAPLVVVPSSAHLSPQGPEKEENQPNHQHDDSNAPKNRNLGDESNQQQDDAEDNHGSLRSALPFRWRYPSGRQCKPVEASRPHVRHAPATLTDSTWNSDRLSGPLSLSDQTPSSPASAWRHLVWICKRDCGLPARTLWTAAVR